MEVLSKDMIGQWILPLLPFSAHGRPSVVDPVELVEVILYKLKSGCQWRYLPLKQFFTGASLTWQGVYARFNAWRKDGSWQAVWCHLLRHNQAHLDCSSVQLDGSHTPAKNGGEAVGYQGRKKARTTTTLFLTDNRGQPLSCARPQAGNCHDSHGLNALFGEICVFLEAAGIAIAGLFLNADKAFDNQPFRQGCARRDIEANIPRNRRAADWQTDDDTFFDPELYRRRVVGEHANAWLDGFKTLLVRYETSVGNWLAWHWLAFVVIFLRKINPKPTF
ncbi:IS5 family transposase [Hymenobacter sp. BT664]|uniref:IS5 family transposase n=1 Tax=Hymenobacter montanus TaxID=2771359 RepID=A0A927GI85_9BACT|nr:IS5 family transposase [Hymenobacter montanus]MBD2767110.1 IS5 family transposase [Hymenobacter montanus]